MPNRPSIPKSVENAIKLLQGFQCCVCGQVNVQIHHIDGNNANNQPANLALLCLNHHDQAEQGKASDGHRLTLKLDAKTIRQAKSSTELAQARRLGFDSVEVFLKDGKIKIPVVAPPKFCCRI
jgi:hypothetical protein